MSVRHSTSTHTCLESHVLPSLVALRLHSPTPIDTTGKRKLDGEYAATRLKKPITAKWVNERCAPAPPHTAARPTQTLPTNALVWTFIAVRQTMVLIREFRNAWTGLLSNDMVEWIRLGVDTALRSAMRAEHVADEYDVRRSHRPLPPLRVTLSFVGRATRAAQLSPTVWAIWLVQYAYATSNGGWLVKTFEDVLNLSFAGMYAFLEHQHRQGGSRNLYESGSGKLLKRYVLPFKSMTVPPKPEHLYKYKKGARRLSSWLQQGGLPPLADGIVAQDAPAILGRLPAADDDGRADARAEAWARVAQQARQRQLRSVTGDDDDSLDARAVVDGILGESRAAAEATEPTELERELAARLQPDADDGPAAAGPADDEPPIEVQAERVGPAAPDEAGGEGGTSGGGTSGGGTSTEDDDELQRLLNELGELTSRM